MLYLVEGNGWITCQKNCRVAVLKCPGIPWQCGSLSHGGWSSLVQIMTLETRTFGVAGSVPRHGSSPVPMLPLLQLPQRGWLGFHCTGCRTVWVGVTQVALALWGIGCIEQVHLAQWQATPASCSMASHSSILAWKIPWTEEPGRLQSMGLQRVGKDWVKYIYLNPGLQLLAFMARGSYATSRCHFCDLGRKNGGRIKGKRPGPLSCLFCQENPGFPRTSNQDASSCSSWAKVRPYDHQSCKGVWDIFLVDVWLSQADSVVRRKREETLDEHLSESALSSEPPVCHITSRSIQVLCPA